jgi:hypothetical protein
MCPDCLCQIAQARWAQARLDASKRTTFQYLGNLALGTRVDTWTCDSISTSGVMHSSTTTSTAGICKLHFCMIWRMGLMPNGTVEIKSDNKVAVRSCTRGHTESCMAMSYNIPAICTRQFSTLPHPHILVFSFSEGFFPLFFQSKVDSEKHVSFPLPTRPVSRRMLSGNSSYWPSS